MNNNRQELLGFSFSYFAGILKERQGVGKEVFDYLLGRGYSEEEILSLDIGAYPGWNKFQGANGSGIYQQFSEDLIENVFEFKDYRDNYKIVFPYRKANGEFLGLWSRTLTNSEDKYKPLTAGTTKNTPYNIENVAGDEIIIVEGPIDVMACVVNGFDNVVATLGTGFTPQKIFEPLFDMGFKKFILALDNDPAGHMVSKKSINYIRSQGFKAHAVEFPEKFKDADDFLEVNEPKEFQRLIEQARNPVLRIAHKIFKEEFSHKPGEKIGLAMDKFKTIAEHCFSIRKGFYIIGGDTNVGKTIFLINIFMSLVESNPEARGIFFSFDDDFEEIFQRMIALKADLPINDVYYDQNVLAFKEKKEEAFKNLCDLFSSKRMDLIDQERASDFKSLESEIANKAGAGSLFVCIDGMFDFDMDSKYSEKRLQEAERAKFLKSLSNKYKIPVICTAEVRKREVGRGTKEPTNRFLTPDDIMETSKYKYKPNVIFLLEINDIQKINEEIIPLRLRFGKNKKSKFRGNVFLNFNREKAFIEETGTDEAIGDSGVPF